MFLFGFSSGLPFLLVGGTLAYWLKEHGIVLSEITIIASAGMLYVFKFLWAPILDHRQAPAGFARLGRRRGWLLLAQLGVTAGLVAMALLTPTQLPLFIVATIHAWVTRYLSIASSAPSGSNARISTTVPPRRCVVWLKPIGAA